MNQEENFLNYLQQIIYQRKAEKPEGSYTTKLFLKGINKISQKVGEEAVELIIEAKDNDDEKFLNEGAKFFWSIVIRVSALGAFHKSSEGFT